MQPLGYVHKRRTKGICDHKKLQGKDNFVSNKQGNDLWVKIPSPDTEPFKDIILMSMS